MSRSAVGNQGTRRGASSVWLDVCAASASSSGAGGARAVSTTKSYAEPRLEGFDSMRVRFTACDSKRDSTLEREPTPSRTVNISDVRPPSPR
jgi:hypothetical protein